MNGRPSCSPSCGSAAQALSHARLFIGAAYLLVAFNFSYSDGSPRRLHTEIFQKGLGVQDQ